MAPPKKTPAGKPAANKAAAPAATAAAKPADWPAPPSVAAGYLHIQVFTAFAVPSPSKPGTWVRTFGNNDKNRKPVERALAFIVGEGTGNVSKGVDAQGATSLRLRTLTDGSYTLRLVPEAKQLSTERAGPALVPGTKEVAYRQLDVKLTWRAGKIARSPAPAAVTDNGRVVAFTEQSLTIDWKPEWLRAKSIHKRKRGVVDAAVLHRTGTATIGPALEAFLTGTANAHYVIDTDGFIVKMVHDSDQASHAGTGAQWNIQADDAKALPVNDFSIGIEHVNEEGHAFTDQQIDRKSVV